MANTRESDVNTMLMDEIHNKQILESIETAQEAAMYLYNFSKEREWSSFFSIVEDLHWLLITLSRTFLELSSEDEYLEKIELGYIKNAIYSLDNIKKMAFNLNLMLLNKIEFEFLPLLENLKYEFYFVANIKGELEREKEFLINETPKLLGNKYIDKAMKTGEYKYDVSIVIMAYNKLEYTKICVENVLKHTPSHINYELILVNHGSQDGTKEFFESLNPTKFIDLQVNGIAAGCHCKIVEGEYYLFISNDVVVTPHYLENLLKCMKSDKDITIVVPTTPNVSNLQTIPCKFDNFKELQEFAKQNNKSDSYRWEQRTRLCDPIALRRTADMYSSQGIGDSYKLFNLIWAFPDDACATIFRRKNKKLMLAKDTFCHHFGSVTLKETHANANVNIDKGRRLFNDFFGIDPWGTGFCYDFNLFEVLEKLLENKNIDAKICTNILGINCGIGSNPLKMKDCLKQSKHNLNVKIFNITDDKCYIEDLAGVSDNAKFIKFPIDFEKIFGHNKFEYIFFESNLSKYHMGKVVKQLISRLTTEGILCLLNYPLSDAKRVKSSLYNGKSWFIYVNH